MGKWRRGMGDGNKREDAEKRGEEMGLGIGLDRRWEEEGGGRRKWK
jgi:hypothetical protein